MIDGQVNAVGRVRRGVGIVLFLLFSLGSLNRAPDDSLRKESKEHRIGYKLGGVVAFLIPIGLYWWGHSARKRARKELMRPSLEKPLLKLRALLQLRHSFIPIGRHTTFGKKK